MRASSLFVRRSLLLSAAIVLASGAMAQDTSSDDATTAPAATVDATTSADAAATTAADSSMPGLTTSSASQADMPTLSTSSTLNTAVPTYPAPSVPPTSNAPYMQVSSLPDGTIFIVVGAILGAFGLAVLLWRAIIAYMLHRSVEKAARAQHAVNDKAPFPAPPAPFYNYTDQDSSQNVASGKGVRRSARGPIPSATPSQTNLFFSPTAAAGGGNRESLYRDNPNRESSYRESRFLAPGFYAAGQASPHSLDGPEGSSISLENLPPSNRGHARGPSGSPGFGPQRPLMEANSSNVNLNEARAPSAYLDDLLAENPEMFPPAGTTPANANYSDHPYRQSGRF
ncbi:unnamed protein product [Discula destructiva]